MTPGPFDAAIGIVEAARDRRKSYGLDEVTDLEAAIAALRDYAALKLERDTYESAATKALAERDALKAENEGLKRQVGIEQRKVSDLDGLLAKYHESAEKAEAELELGNKAWDIKQKQLEKAEARLAVLQPIEEAVKSIDLEKIREADDDGMIISAFMECAPLIKAALALKEKGNG
jgi:hypothetical protein